MVVNAGGGNGLLGPTVIGNFTGRSAVNAAKKAVEAQTNSIKSLGGQIFRQLDPQTQWFVNLKWGGPSGAINAFANKRMADFDAAMKLNPVETYSKVFRQS